MLANLLLGPPQKDLRSVAITEALVLLGAVGGFAFMISLTGGPTLTLVVAVVTVILHWSATQRRTGLAWTVVRWGARPPFLVALGFFLYQTASLGYMLAWSVPWWAWLLVVALAFGTVVSSLPWWSAPRLPAVLPIGVWIAACLVGGKAEQGMVRCDDHLRAASQSGVLIVPSAAEQEACQSGASFSVLRHPRKIFASPLGEDRYIVATGGHQQGAVGWLDGALCEVQMHADLAQPPRCGLHDSDHTYGAAVRSSPPGIYVAGESGLLRTHAEHPFEQIARGDTGKRRPANVLYEPNTDRVFAFFDGIDGIGRHRGSDLVTIDFSPIRIGPEEIRFDAERQEGLYCFASMPFFPIEGSGYVALAFGNDPASLRLLGSAWWTPVSFSDGCDLDSERRRVYAGVGTLGLVVELDYDSGELLDTHWVGFGVRPLLLDAGRQRLYTGNYLNGEVVELTVDGEVLRRWFAGRFIRHLLVDPDQSALFVTSTLGVVRIPL